MLLPGLLLLYLIVWRPVLMGGVLSAFELKGYEPTNFVGLQNYVDVLTDTQFVRTLWNTVLYVFWSVVLGFALPIVVAIMLNEMVRGKGFFKFITYFPAIVPTVAVSMIWYYVYLPDQGGLLNMFLGMFGAEPHQWLQNASLTIPLIVLTMVWKGFGGTAIMYLAALQGISQDLYEAAKIDGAGAFRRLRHITLPQMAPMILLFLIRQMIGVFQVMVEPMTMTGGGPNNASLTLALQGYNYAFTYFQPQKALALGVITFLILVVMTIFYFAIEKRVSID